MRQHNLFRDEDIVAAIKKHSTDARQVHPTTNPGAMLWADAVPLSWRPFVQLSRIDMLAGSLMIFWPCAWGILASAYRLGLSPLTVAQELLLYFIGSVIMHSAACTWNDMCDKGFDAKVERTKHRPLAAGTVSVFGAILFIIPQVAVLCGMLSLTNIAAVQMGLLGLCILTPLYPLMKRVTYWPQAWLGLGMNWGFIVAWIANAGPSDIRLPAALYFGCWCWTLHYDTTYAMQDKVDDAKAGVKSTALLFGASARPILSTFCVGFVLSLAYFGILNRHGPAYFIFTVLGSAAHLFWQIATLDVDNPKNCFAKFDANGRHMGFIVSSGMAIDYAMRVFV